MLKVVLLFCLNYCRFVISSDDNECGLKVIDCKNSSIYRSIDGSCNNLNYPNWGTVFSIYDRLLPAKYGDGEHSIPTTLKGQELPNARNLSTKIYPHVMPETVSEFSLSAMQYGQVVVYDMAFTYTLLDIGECCTKDLKFFEAKDEPKGCASIKIPANDPFYASVNATCISMERTVTNRDLSCLKSLKHAEQLTIVNNWLDLSVVYGNTNEEHKALRAFQNGFLRVEERNKHEWLPFSTNVSRDCPGNVNPSEICYRSGDNRTNQNPQLTLILTLLVRNHNKIARELKKLNTHWTDERLFQEARRINIAEHQHVSYYEMLPVYLGKENLIKHKILYQTDGFVNDYDSNIRPHVYNEHAQGANRQFHSLIAGKLSLINPGGQTYDSLVLRDHFNRPTSLEKFEIFDGYIRGLAMQPQMASDIYFDPDVTRHLFMRFLKFGGDLKAIDIQRSRDHGVASYNDMRALCGLKKANTLEEFSDEIDKDKIDLLKLFYDDPNDVDLIVGGSLEQNEKGTLAGPTFNCILLKQYYRTRRSDRFWYENDASGFSLPQLKEIRKFTIAKLFCDNGNNITLMQKRAFLQVSSRNPRWCCKKIPGPNLKLWKENV